MEAREQELVRPSTIVDQIQQVYSVDRQEAETLVMSAVVISTQLPDASPPDEDGNHVVAPETVLEIIRQMRTGEITEEQIANALTLSGPSPSEHLN